MGGEIAEENRREQGGEAVADLRVRATGLHGVDVDPALVGDMIDEFPILFVAAALAEGETRVSGAAELRVKESDRIATMTAGLRRLGIRVAETPDGAVIEGGRLQDGRIDSLGDHRVAMAFAVAAQVATGEVEIADCANVATSFPGFVDLAQSIGFMLQSTEN
jgi:3-phosphoshikimate 1-carboxyvinyltransferase